MVVISSKRAFKVSLPFDFGIGYESAPITGEDVKFLNVVEQLKGARIRKRAYVPRSVSLSSLSGVTAHPT